MKFNASAIGAAAACVLCFCMCTNIEGVDRPRLVLELYNHAKTQTLKFLHPNVGLPMDYEEATCLVGRDIDSYNDKIMKIRVPAKDEGNEIDTQLYNHYNGDGVAEKAVKMLKEMSKKDPKIVLVQSD